MTTVDDRLRTLAALEGIENQFEKDSSVADAKDTWRVFPQWNHYRQRLKIHGSHGCHLPFNESPLYPPTTNDQSVQSCIRKNSLPRQPPLRGIGNFQANAKCRCQFQQISLQANFLQTGSHPIQDKSG